LFSQFNDAVIDHEEIKEFVAEPWFILLLAGVITLMVILLAAVLFVRYRQLGAKKSHLGGNYVFGIFQCAVHAIRFSENRLTTCTCLDSLNPANKLSYSSGFKTTMDVSHRGQVASFLQSEHSVSNSQRCLFIDANSCHKPNWYLS